MACQKVRIRSRGSTLETVLAPLWHPCAQWYTAGSGARQAARLRTAVCFYLFHSEVQAGPKDSAHRPTELGNGTTDPNHSTPP
jgi:hypothetical protein